MEFSLNRQEKSPCIVSQEQLKKLLEGKEIHRFIREKTRKAIIVTPENRDKIQSLIDSAEIPLGSFDKTSYENSPYFDGDGKIKAGIAIMVNGPEDMYPNPNFRYEREVSSQENETGEGENEQLSPPLSSLLREYAVKEERKMVKGSDVFNGKTVRIEAPWGGTQELRPDGWINVGNELYVINADPETGLPAGGFVKVENEGE